ncbi:MAG TPA: hypothetical protein VHF90_09280, partial [Thermoleophilaceae bacterium]|nr:hypothetical protein [Thermoleophilaceae bacterium]
MGVGVGAERPAGVLARGPWSPEQVKARWSEQPFEPDEQQQAGRQPDQGLGAEPLGRHRPLLLELARQRVGGILADLDRAP